MDTSIINALGFGAGIDTAKLVRDLADASRLPKLELFDGRARANQARISAVAQALSDLDNFASSFAALVAGGSLQTQPTTSDEAALAAAASLGARLGNLAGEVVIEQLAKAQTIFSGFVAAAADPVGLGSLTLSVGGTSHTITIDSTNNSLDGLAAAINASGSGVVAKVSNDGAGARLLLKGPLGAAGAFTLAVDAGADPGLASFAFDGVGGGMTLGQAAQDAAFSVDGVLYTRATNSIADVIPGVTLTLKRAAPGTATSSSRRWTRTALACRPSSLAPARRWPAAARRCATAR